MDKQEAEQEVERVALMLACQREWTRAHDEADPDLMIELEEGWQPEPDEDDWTIARRRVARLGGVEVQAINESDEPEEYEVLTGAEWDARMAIGQGDLEAAGQHILTAAEALPGYAEKERDGYRVLITLGWLSELRGAAQQAGMTLRGVKPPLEQLGASIMRARERAVRRLQRGC